MRYGRILLIGLFLFLVACGGDKEPTPTATTVVLTVPATPILTPAQPGLAPTPDLGLPLTATAVMATALASVTPLASATPVLPTLAASTPGGIAGTHVVQQGDTLYCIGRAYGVLPLAIAQANNIYMETVLVVGQSLLIPAVRWEDMAAGTVCQPQFQPPFAGLPPSTATSAGPGPVATTPAAPGPTATAAPVATGVTPSPTVAVPTVSVPDTRGVELINISQPGTASRLLSPVHVAGEAEGAFEQSLVVNIVVNGQVIATAIAQIAADMGQRGPFSVDVPFTLPAGSPQETPAHILVYHISPRDGAAAHLSSTLVYLLPPGGTQAINPGGSAKEFFAINEPAQMATVGGGLAHVTGYSDPVFESQIGIVICGDGGTGAPHLLCGTANNVLGTGFAMVQSPDVGQPGPFAADVAYSVAAPRGGTIVLFVTSPMDGTVTHIYSRPVNLAP